MDQNDDGRVPALKFALFLIALTAVVGAFLLMIREFGPGALLLATACLSMTLLVRP